MSSAYKFSAEKKLLEKLEVWWMFASFSEKYVGICCLTGLKF